MSIDIVKTRESDDNTAFGLPFDWVVGGSLSPVDTPHHDPTDPCAGVVTKIKRRPEVGLVREDMLDTAVILSLWCDARADENTLPNSTLSAPLISGDIRGVTERRGWCGDEFVNRAAQPWGSLIWTRLFTKANKERYREVDAVDKFIRWTARQSLQHLIDDGVAREIEVATAWPEKGRLALYIKIFKPDQLTPPYKIAWDITMRGEVTGV